MCGENSGPEVSEAESASPAGALPLVADALADFRGARFRVAGAAASLSADRGAGSTLPASSENSDSLMNGGERCRGMERTSRRGRGPRFRRKHCETPCLSNRGESGVPLSKEGANEPLFRENSRLKMMEAFEIRQGTNLKNDRKGVAGSNGTGRPLNRRREMRPAGVKEGAADSRSESVQERGIVSRSQPACKSFFTFPKHLHRPAPTPPLQRQAETSGSLRRHSHGRWQTGEQTTETPR